MTNAPPGDTPMSDRPGVEIDRDACIGAGNCAQAAPLTFDTDDEGTVVLLDPTASTIDDLTTAEENCPAGAIRLV